MSSQFCELLEGEKLDTQDITFLVYVEVGTEAWIGLSSVSAISPSLIRT